MSGRERSSIKLIPTGVYLSNRRRPRRLRPGTRLSTGRVRHFFPLQLQYLKIWHEKKATPRLELGIRVLQTPALPLGHVALGN